MKFSFQFKICLLAKKIRKKLFQPFPTFSEGNPFKVKQIRIITEVFVVLFWIVF